MIKISTLGRAAIHQDGSELSQLAAHKQKFALFTYLSIEGPVSRDHLVGLFWPERDDERARHSLSQALYALKRELGEHCFKVEGDAISVDPSRIAVDANEFVHAAEQGDWEVVTSLYGGPFLDGFHLPGTAGFEDWQSQTRIRLGRLARNAFSRLVASREAAGDSAGALSLAWHWSTLEPLEDEAQHALITLLARAGERVEALEQFEAYRRRLDTALGVTPLDDTMSLVERIRRGQVPDFQPLKAHGQQRQPAAAPHSPAIPPLIDDLTARSVADTRASPRAPMGPWARLTEQLRHQRVLRVALAYLAFSALALELTDVLIERSILQDWVFPALLAFLLTSLPVVLLLAWIEGRVSADHGAHDRWPRWIENARARYVLGIAVVLAIGLVAGRMYVNRGPEQAAAELSSGSLNALRIAVLYFDDHSENQSLRHIAEGLTESLIHELTQVDVLDVLSRHAVKPYRNRTIPLDSIVRDLEVGTIVEGSIRESRNKLQLNAQLIDAATGSHLASVALERPRSRSIELVGDLAREVSAALRQRLGLEIRIRELRAGTESAEAWESLQKAEAVLEDAEELWTLGDTAAASRFLRDADSLLAYAEALDPDWLEPIVLRGWTAGTRSRLFGASSGDYEPAAARLGISHAERALALSPNAPAALELRGVLLAYLWEVADSTAADSLFAAAERDLRAASTADPTRAEALARLSRILQERGRLAEAKLVAEQAYLADAFQTELREILFRLCYISHASEDFEDAARWCSEGNRRFPGDASYIEIELSLLASSAGPEPNLDQAWRLFNVWLDGVAPQRRPANRPIGLLYVAAVAARAAQQDSALALIELAHAVDEQKNPELAYYEANARLQLGDREAAIRLLREYLAAYPGEADNIVNIDWYWTELRSDSSFQQLAPASN